jgi:hypothetical protein
MKLSRSSFALLALNVAWLTVLSCWVIRRGQHVPEFGPRVEYITNYAVAPYAPVAVLTNVVTTNDFRWAQLESEDYRAYIARLRSVGCPEQTIRDIVIADVDKLLAPRMQAARSGAQDVKFWKPIEQELWEDAEQKEALRKQRAIDFEKREVIRELLGVDLVGERLRNQGQDDYYGQRLAFLPEEKRARVRLVLDQFADRERTLLEQQIEETDSVFATDEVVAMHQQKEAALAPLLTPAEREQYDLWFSPAASRVRESVFGMGATEEEFVKLYQLQREFETQEGSSTSEEGWALHQAKIRETLGEPRYAEYVRAQDGDYRELVRLASRFKLEPELAAQLYSFKEPVEQERARVERDPTLTAEQKTAAFEAIARETERAFQQALGDKAFRQFMRRPGASWLRGTGATAGSGLAASAK